MSEHRKIKSSMIFLVGMTICLICLIFDKEVAQATNKLELSGYIGESLSETITQFENMSEPSWSMGITSSFNKQVCFAGAGDAADKDVITRIIISGEDNPYSLYGVSTDMSEEEIRNVLAKQGFGRMYCNNTYYREELFINIEQRQNAEPAITLAEISWGKHRDKEDVFSYIGGTMQQALEGLEGLSMRVVGEQVVAGTEGLEFRGNLYSRDPILTQITRITISGFNNGYSIYGVIPGDVWNSGRALNFPSGGSGEFLDPAGNILDLYGINSSENPSIELSMINIDSKEEYVTETQTVSETEEIEETVEILDDLSETITDNVMMPSEVGNCSYEGKWYYIVSEYQPGIAIHPIPDKKSDTLGVIPHLEEFFVEYISDNYGYTTYNGCSGWINIGDYADRIISPTELEDCVYDGRRYYITSEFEPGIAIHPIPDKKSATLGVIPHLEEFDVDFVSGKYGYTSYNGCIGWINIGDYALPIESSSSYTNPEIISQPDETFAVPINSSYFPDDVFRNYVQREFDLNGNGSLSTEECLQVEYINLDCSEESYGSLRSLRGIEYFPNLIVLMCDYNHVSELDVRDNPKLQILTFNHNQVSSIDLSNNTELIEFYATDNYLSELDVRNNLKLQAIYCDDNYVQYIDIRNNTNLNFDWTDFGDAQVLQ